MILTYHLQLQMIALIKSKKLDYKLDIGRFISINLILEQKF